MRPYDGSVLFTAGQEAGLAGDTAGAERLWRASFQVGGKHQLRLLKALGGQVPARKLIEWLQPDLAGLSQMLVYYQQRQPAAGHGEQPLRGLWESLVYCREHPSDGDLACVTEQYAAACAREVLGKPASEAAGLWVKAGRAYQGIGRFPEAVRRFREAMELDPLHYEARFLLGSCLLETKDYDEAARHLKWCVQQGPRNQEARDALERAIDGQLRRGSRPVITAAIPAAPSSEKR